MFQIKEKYSEYLLTNGAQVHYNMGVTATQRTLRQRETDAHSVRQSIAGGCAAAVFEKSLTKGAQNRYEHRKDRF
mgnify:CR=1 FL=1